MGLKPEGGVTRISLDNGAFLLKQKGRPVHVDLRLVDGEYETVAYYADGSKFIFTGFSWGYSGEGPFGLTNWCYSNGVPLDAQQIFALDRRFEGVVFSWPEKASMTIVEPDGRCRVSRRVPTDFPSLQELQAAVGGRIKLFERVWAGATVPVLGRSVGYDQIHDSMSLPNSWIYANEKATVLRLPKDRDTKPDEFGPFFDGPFVQLKGFTVASDVPFNRMLEQDEQDEQGAADLLDAIGQTTLQPSDANDLLVAALQPPDES